MRPTGKWIAIGLLALTVGAGGAESSRDIVPAGKPGDDSYSFRLVTPRWTGRPLPDGSQHIEIEGFGTRERRPGAPDIPTRTVRIAIPPGATPELIVRSGPERLHPGPRPAPVSTERIDFAESEITERLPGAALRELAPGRVDRTVRRVAVREAAAEFYEGGPFPERGAWLGEIGVLRDQRYVDVHLAPLRWDPRRSGVSAVPWIEVEIRFAGGEATRTAPVSDPRFEAVYRRAFVNYAQGRTFRLTALAAGRPSTGPSSEAVSPEPRVLANSTGGGVDNPAARRKIFVRTNGVVRLDHTRMSTTGFAPEPLSTWKLMNRGVEVPLHVMDDDGDGIPEPTDGNDLLDPGEWVQFYGEALDDEPKTALNTAGAIDIFEARDFTDQNVYFLSVESGVRARVAARDALPTFTRTPPADFEALARAEIDDAWRPLGAADPWWWGPTLAGGDSRTDTLPLPGLASGTASARVRVELQGRSEDSAVDPDHHTRISLLNNSNQVLATNDDDGTFDGRSVYLHDFTWPGTGGTLTDPAKVTTEALPPGMAARNDVIRNWIEIYYRRTFQASGDTLTFDWPDGDAEFVITGIVDVAPEVYEITGVVAGSEVVEPVRLLNADVTGVGPYSARFRIDNDPGLADGTMRRFVVAGAGAVSVPPDPDFPTDTVSDLRNTATQADIVVIAHPDLLDDPANCSDAVLTQLLNLRSTRDGLSSKVACLEDVQDEFNDGLPGPLAIRNFLAWVMSTAPGEGWAAPKPSYVLLLGDASFDYKAGTAAGSFTPTQILFRDDVVIGYYGSDNVMGAVVGTDQLADLVMGRITARTAVELDLVLQKILDYEQAAPTGNWRRHALTVSDRGKRAGDGSINVGESTEFENTNASGLSSMKAPPHTSRHLRYYTDYCAATPPVDSCDIEPMRQDIKDAVNGVAGSGSDGASIVQFVGHGNFEVWSDDAYLDERNPPPRDTDSFNNGLRLPWMLAHNCLTGGFHSTLDHSVGEDWLLRDDGTGGGGAVAVFAPTGLSFGFIGRTVSDIIWDDLFGAQKERNVAVPIMDSLAQLCGQGSIEPCQNYAFLGDPAMSLVFPSVDAPSTLLACSGHQQVDLSWAASSTPGVTYDVYRTDNLNLGYTLVQSGVAGTTFSDTGLINTRTYYYYVVAVDGEGFESAWSNFNRDCPSAGDDCVGDGDGCVQATPLNPNPPAPPTGVAVVDAESGGRLDVSWNANTENDLDFYEVHYSTQPGCFDNVGCTPTTDNVRRATSHVIQGLQNGTEYFVVVTATNTSGKRSAASAEQSDIPHLVRGLRSPAFVSDLRVDKSGADALLSWTPVTTDLYDKTETVARYEVYRGLTPQFVPSTTTKIGEPTTPEFTDTGAMGSGTPDYHYLVRAVDNDGNGGGLGEQLPNGIADLSEDWALTGQCSVTTGQSCLTDPECPAGETCITQPDRSRLILSWTPVTANFDGGPVAIDRYEVYASDTPFSRSAICDPFDGACTGLTPVATTAASSIELTPPVQDRYYSVLAVDKKENKSPF